MATLASYNAAPMDIYFKFEMFKPSDTEVPDDGNGPNYYGFVSLSGQYYILRETISGFLTTLEYYFPVPAGVYATDWAARSGLTYSRYDLAFPKLG